MVCAEHEVVTIDIQDKAANISRNRALLSKLADSPTPIEVSDQENAINGPRQGLRHRRFRRKQPLPEPRHPPSPSSRGRARDHLDIQP